MKFIRVKDTKKRRKIVEINENRKALLQKMTIDLITKRKTLQVMKQMRKIGLSCCYWEKFIQIEELDNERENLFVLNLEEGD